MDTNIEDIEYTIENKTTTKTFEQLPAGTYECLLNNYEFKTTTRGTTYLAITFVIREDVASNPEKYKKWKIFENIYFDSENGQMNKYSFYAFQNIMNAVCPREETEYKSTLKTMLQALHGGKCKIKISYKATQDLKTEQNRRYFATDYNDKIQLETNNEIKDLLDQDLPFYTGETADKSNDCPY